MRTVRVHTPEGEASRVAAIAMGSGIVEVSIHRVDTIALGGRTAVKEVVEVETPTPTARKFVDTLMEAPFFDPHEYSIAVLEPTTIVSKHSPREETIPFTRPQTDVWEDLWQTSHITASLVGRALVASALLAYGMIELHYPILIAGLLFLPYHQHFFLLGLGITMREWRSVALAVAAVLTTTTLIVLAGVIVASLVEHPMRFMEFSPPAAGVTIATIVGIAGGLASADDAGRRELIGLAATAHISVVPAWFGIALVDGFPDPTITGERLLSYALSITGLTLGIAVTFLLLRMTGAGARRFAAATSHNAG